MHGTIFRDTYPGFRSKHDYAYYSWGRPPTSRRGCLMAGARRHNASMALHLRSPSTNVASKGPADLSEVTAARGRGRREGPKLPRCSPMAPKTDRHYSRGCARRQEAAWLCATEAHSKMTHCHPTFATSRTLGASNGKRQETWRHTERRRPPATPFACKSPGATASLSATTPHPGLARGSPSARRCKQHSVHPDIEEVPGGCKAKYVGEQHKLKQQF